jgi:hemolysin III
MKTKQPAQAAASRPYSREEEIASSASHSLGAIAGIPAMAALLRASVRTGDGLVVMAYALFGLSLLLLFGASAAYHAVSAPELKRRLRILDHASIYVLIAGTYSTFCLTALRGATGWIIFSLIWTLAAVGVALAFFFTGRFKILSTSAYVIMGWIVAFAFAPLHAALSARSFTLLIAGGVLYTVGAVVYALKRLPWTHPIWHCFVLGGAFCHFLSALGALGSRG